MRIKKQTIVRLREIINEEGGYRTGPMLVDFFNQLGFADSYGQGFPSRWAYTEEKLNRLNGTERMKECIENTFDPINFVGKFDEWNQLTEDFNQYLIFDSYKIVKDGNTAKIVSSTKEAVVDEGQFSAEDEFLKKDFEEISINDLKLGGAVTKVLEQRLEEIKKCLESESALATIFLCGSALEGILFGVAAANPKQFNSARSAPKDEAGDNLQFNEWKLNDLINVAKEKGFLDQDMKKFSHVLRDFRNYIHPREQVSQQFDPTKQTAEICWHVLKGAIVQIKNNNS